MEFVFISVVFLSYLEIMEDISGLVLVGFFFWFNIFGLRYLYRFSMEDGEEELEEYDGEVFVSFLLV